MAKKTRPPRRPSLTTLRNRRQETLTLSRRYFINGEPYGPGEVTVRGDVAGGLREMECRNQQYEQSWNRPRAALITGGTRAGVTRAVAVPYDTFDSAWMSANPTPLAAFPAS